jgi:hypothetical protein
VLRTASVSISRSSALVFGGSRLGGCHWVSTHRSLNKDAPVSRLVQRAGVIRSHAILGGLHHHYGRIYGFRYTQATSPVDYQPARARACTRSVTARSLSLFSLRNASIRRGPWAASDILMRIGVLISLVFFAPVGSHRKNTGRRTFSTAAICTIMAALMRLTPFSYF